MEAEKKAQKPDWSLQVRMKDSETWNNFEGWELSDPDTHGLKFDIELPMLSTGKIFYI